MIDPFDDAPVELAADADVVEDGQVLDVFAQADAAGMRANRHAELRGEEEDRQHLVHTTDATRVDLADVDRLRLEELFEHHPVLDVFARGDGDGRNCAPNRRVPSHVVWARRLFDPPRLELTELAHRLDRLSD